VPVTGMASDDMISFIIHMKCRCVVTAMRSSTDPIKINPMD
jgi:hypothetical protein